MTFDGVGRMFSDDLHALGLRLRRLTNAFAMSLDVVAERLDPTSAANLHAQRLAAEARRFVVALDDLLLGAAPPGDVNPL